MKNLRIWSDRDLLPENHDPVLMLAPFWGAKGDNEHDPDYGRFQPFFQECPDIFTLVAEPENADVCVLPFAWNPGNASLCEKANIFTDRAAKAGKKTLVFFNSDSVEEVPLENSIIFRTSLFRSTRKPNEFALPGWSVDFTQRYLDGVPLFTMKNAIPSVGYCGYVDYTPQDGFFALARYAFKTHLLGRKSPEYARLRGLALRTLMDSPGIKVNYIRRQHFWGGRFVRLDKSNLVRREYVQNMLESDYNLAVRGAGNFSYRQYEIMSLGRIPLFVDTDSVLPFDHMVNWKDYWIWIGQDEVDIIASKLLAFHSRLSAAEFTELQKQNRNLWEQYISPVGFHRNLKSCIEPLQ